MLVQTLCFALLASLVTAGRPSSCNATVNFHKHLAPLLSKDAFVVTPDDPRFSEYTHQNLKSNPPTYSVVVVVDTEDDVSTAVKFANRHNIPFAAKVSGHGTWSGLGEMRGGMNIWLRNLNSVNISEDGQHVTVGGGTFVTEVVEALWEAGKQTATALGQCIGITGSGIGGGLGPLNGIYGLGLDQFLSFHVVLANGSFVTASQTVNPDLFWALRGAGHNFGIITSAKLRIYDRADSSTWSYQQFYFTEDKLEAVFETLNTKLDTQPGHLTHDVSIYQIGMDSAIIDLRIFSAAYTPAELDLYTAPFHALGPIDTTSVETDYLGLISEMGYAPPEEGCTPPHGSFGGVFGVGVTRHNPAAMRNMYDLFNNVTLSVPELGDSYVFIEGYGTEAVRKVDVMSTAFPGRGIRAWPNVVLAYKGDAKDDTLEGIVKEQGEKMREAMLEGQERQTTYVNYAMEQESLQALYGYEEWRLEKLRKLKREVDPHNRFGFFAPIH